MNDTIKRLYEDVFYIVIALLIGIVIGVCLNLNGLFSDPDESTLPIQFMSQYIPADVAEIEYQSAQEYGLDWLLTFSLTMVESGGKRYAQSHKDCHGYKQLYTYTAGCLRSVFMTTMSNTDIYNPDFNIRAGNLFLCTVLKDFAKYDMSVALQMYNLGTGSYFRGSRNYKYTTLIYTRYEYYKAEYKKFVEEL